jgi:hypothetical protein
VPAALAQRARNGTVHVGRLRPARLTHLR